MSLCCRVYLYNLKSSSKILFQPLLNRIHELTSNNPRLTIGTTTSKREILGHDTVLIDRVNTSLLNGLRKDNQLLIVVELTPVFETSSPSKDTVISKVWGGRYEATGLVLVSLPFWCSR